MWCSCMLNIYGGIIMNINILVMILMFLATPFLYLGSLMGIEVSLIIGFILVWISLIILIKDRITMILKK